MRKLTSNSIYNAIKINLEGARYSAYRAVNFTMVIAYWEIGRRIVVAEQEGSNRAAYGANLIKQLSIKLTADFGKGFTETNLKYFRQFYLTFPPQKKGHAPRDKSETGLSQKSHALRAELSWTHYRLLIKVESEAARNYYLSEAIAQNWSARALERQINSFYYERILSSKKDKAVLAEAKRVTEALTDSPEDFIKDPYVLEFLRLSTNHSF